MLTGMPQRIGSVFRWRANALGVDAGAIGFCYAQLRDGRVRVLFSTGTPLSLTPIELNRYAEHLGHAAEMAFYRFEDLGRLLDDFARGRFAAVFRHAEDAARRVA